ncbi:MAG: ankyrin repeat domain-containing protein, partial [Spirochaetales bacterium]|nr:ankyrin repeat domain-containing protein [Spirochaetales bacterium]
MEVDRGALILRRKAGLIEGMSGKQSRRGKKEEKILDEVRERVIRESMNLKEKESIRQAREAELEALKEISDLPNRRIQEIDREVRSGFKKKEKRKWGISRKILRRVVRWAILIGVIAAVIGISAVVRGRREAQLQAQLAAEEAVRNLYEAASEGNLQMVQYLVDEGAPIEPPDYRTSLLHVAVTGSHLDVVEYLLAEGADVNRTDSNGHTVIYLAEERPNLAVRRVVTEAFAEASPEGSPVR